MLDACQVKPISTIRIELRHSRARYRTVEDRPWTAKKGSASWVQDQHLQEVPCSDLVCATRKGIGHSFQSLPAHPQYQLEIAWDYPHRPNIWCTRACPGLLHFALVGARTKRRRVRRKSYTLSPGGFSGFDALKHVVLLFPEELNIKRDKGNYGRWKMRALYTLHYRTLMLINVAKWRPTDAGPEFLKA